LTKSYALLKEILDNQDEDFVYIPLKRLYYKKLDITKEDKGIPRSGKR
jgi:hypothetical protein